MSRRTIAVIGGGRMGEAIVAGLLAAGTRDAGDIIVAEPDPVRRELLSSAYGVVCEAEGGPAAAAAEDGIVLLAVKPQVIDGVVTALAGSVGPGTLVVSIAAGVATARLESALPAGTAVVRVMPNTPAMVREGMSVVSGGSAATREQVESVRELFAAIGSAVVLDESCQDAATAISGSGPAYVAVFVDALVRGGVAEGLDADVARELALRTLGGTAALLETTGQSPDDLVAAVSSPGGTTVAALGVLGERGFADCVQAAVAAAAARARELGA